MTETMPHRHCEHCGSVLDLNGQCWCDAGKDVDAARTEISRLTKERDEARADADRLAEEVARRARELGGACGVQERYRRERDAARKEVAEKAELLEKAYVKPLSDYVGINKMVMGGMRLVSKARLRELLPPVPGWRVKDGIKMSREHWDELIVNRATLYHELGLDEPFDNAEELGGGPGSDGRVSLDRAWLKKTLEALRYLDQPISDTHMGWRPSLTLDEQAWRDARNAYLALCLCAGLENTDD